MPNPLLPHSNANSSRKEAITKEESKGLLAGVDDDSDEHDLQLQASQASSESWPSKRVAIG
ncbi:hypothetical protein HWV62_40172, partial [Athelia sp. TMB]